MLLQQTEASKHVELPYFQGSRREVLLAQKGEDRQRMQRPLYFYLFHVKHDLLRLIGASLAFHARSNRMFWDVILQIWTHHRMPNADKYVNN